MPSRTTPRSLAHPEGEAVEAVESVSPEVAARRIAISRKIIKRYRLDKMLDPLTDRMLVATVKSHDDLFTAARIPTERFDDLYVEGMLEHPAHLMTPVDWLAAWRRIVAREEGQADRIERGAKCKTCNGTGRMWAWVPDEIGGTEGRDVEVECFYGCAKIVALAVS